MREHTRWVLVSIAVSSIVTTVVIVGYYSLELRKTRLLCPAVHTTVYT